MATSDALCPKFYQAILFLFFDFLRLVQSEKKDPDIDDVGVHSMNQKIQGSCIFRKTGEIMEHRLLLRFFGFDFNIRSRIRRSLKGNISHSVTRIQLDLKERKGKIEQEEPL